MPNLQGLRVLFVDDEPFLMRPTIEALEAKGCTVDTAENGTEALEYLKANNSNPPDLVVLDLMMPGGTDIDTDDQEMTTGIVVFRRIREELRLEVPIVISTVITDRDLLMTLEGDSKTALVQKPYTSARLFDVMGEVLHGPRRDR
ncbi:MAG: response regulator [Thermodesulfobacteriota bacterium]